MHSRFIPQTNVWRSWFKIYGETYGPWEHYGRIVTIDEFKNKVRFGVWFNSVSGEVRGDNWFRPDGSNAIDPSIYISELRACEPSVRRKAAIALAKSGAAESVEELVHLVEGNVRTYQKI